MKLEKAIELSEIILTNFDPDLEEDEKDAIQLGIEALEHLEVGRNNPGTHWNDPLPSETED